MIYKDQTYIELKEKAEKRKARAGACVNDTVTEMKGHNAPALNKSFDFWATSKIKSFRHDHLTN